MRALVGHVLERPQVLLAAPEPAEGRPRARGAPEHRLAADPRAGL